MIDPKRLEEWKKCSDSFFIHERSRIIEALETLWRENERLLKLNSHIAHRNIQLGAVAQAAEKHFKYFHPGYVNNEVLNALAALKEDADAK